MVKHENHNLDDVRSNRTPAPKRREYLRAYAITRARKLRAAWILENGPCQDCGSKKRLEIDHINPALKSYNMGEIWQRSKAFRDVELAKCQVLCRPCHQRKTSRDNKSGEFSPCGVRSKYDWGCRCFACKRAKADANNEIRWKNGTRTKGAPRGRRKKS